jgi:hypothetical protein
MRGLVRVLDMRGLVRARPQRFCLVSRCALLFAKREVLLDTPGSVSGVPGLVRFS